MFASVDYMLLAAVLAFPFALALWFAWLCHRAQEIEFIDELDAQLAYIRERRLNLEVVPVGEVCISCFGTGHLDGFDRCGHCDGTGRRP